MKKLKKSLGQHFLIDKNITKKILKQTEIFHKKIIEIGPGNGFLTDEIIKLNPKQLILIEKDNDLSEILKCKYIKKKNITIFNNDALNFDYSKLKNYKLISNLPYNISSKLIFKFIKNNNIFNEMVLMIQKELATKYDYSKRSKNNKYKFILEAFTEYKICFNVSRNVFFPKPKVQSSVIKIKLKKNDYNFEKIELFSNNIFKYRRKKISNTIKFKGKENHLMHKRAEDLNFIELMELFNIS